MRIEVVVAIERRVVELELPEGASAGDAIAALFPEGRAFAGLAIHGQRIEVDTALQEGDRLELLEALLVDPKDNRRRRAGRARP